MYEEVGKHNKQFYVGVCVRWGDTKRAMNNHKHEAQIRSKCCENSFRTLVNKEVNS